MPFQFQSRRRTYPTDNPRVARILVAAKRVFLRDGAAIFSGRTVAREAKVSLGSLQHFFPTMEGLLVAMLEYVTNEYDEAYNRAFERLPFNGEARLRAALDYLISDIWRPETRSFFFGLWALSCHNRFAERIMNEMYAYHWGNVATFVGAARPNLSEEQCKAVSMQIAAYIDGLMLFTGRGAKRGVSRREFHDMVVETVLRLISIDGAAAGQILPIHIVEARPGVTVVSQVGA
jgi:AcrR family transcriptional regulator